MVFKAFCKSLDCSFGRSIVCRRSKSVSRVSSIPVGTNTTPSMTEAVQCGITPWNGAVSGVQHGSLLAEGAFGSVCSQVGFGEWKCVLLSPWITSIPAVATSWTHEWWWQGQLGKRLTRLPNVYVCCFLNSFIIPFICSLSLSFRLCCFYFIFFSWAIYLYLVRADHIHVFTTDYSSNIFWASTVRCSLRHWDYRPWSLPS